MENANPTLHQNKVADKKAYMREYMRKRYRENKEECRAYKNSVKCRLRNNLPAEQLKTHGKFLNDIYKLRKLKEKLPSEVFLQIVHESIPVETTPTSSNETHKN